MKRKLLVTASLVSVMFIGMILGGPSNANASVINEKADQNNERTDFNAKQMHEGTRDGEPLLSPVINTNAANNYTNDQISYAAKNNFASNEIQQERDLLTTIRITARPYAEVWKFTPWGRMVKTGRSLATGTEWAAYVNTSSGFWKVSSNEFIRLNDAVWVG
ncbi:hypothetical protein [Companilactobacillus sp.]|uniref:hypothetical protein n=1 Tax=Companilactobacillus sp. TaxID=2767905 RepID=UPI0025C69AF6|nr:hypothetical protein [Companilactobacillus sp.]MCH4008503.1 hypothetical protein [Companilactobacillus sp.]MCH4051318.1 hypothetical protein [Companilactobacillus sp.]MCH4076446.1 hypothetical protein [Companilactobacillus sp.]MCH4125021.1 hypothetical protein [Companilactobacillus sp.]MCH4131563.1 hypothetical protein [Companilactobacillus sp.]